MTKDVTPEILDEIWSYIDDLEKKYKCKIKANVEEIVYED